MDVLLKCGRINAVIFQSLFAFDIFYSRIVYNETCSARYDLKNFCLTPFYVNFLPTWFFVTPKEVLNFFLKTIDGIKTKIVFICLIFWFIRLSIEFPEVPLGFRSSIYPNSRTYLKCLLNRKVFQLNMNMDMLFQLEKSSTDMLYKTFIRYLSSDMAGRKVLKINSHCIVPLESAFPWVISRWVEFFPNFVRLK